MALEAFLMRQMELLLIRLIIRQIRKQELLNRWNFNNIQMSGCSAPLNGAEHPSGKLSAPLSGATAPSDKLSAPFNGATAALNKLPAPLTGAVYALHYFQAPWKRFLKALPPTNSARHFS